MTFDYAVKTSAKARSLRIEVSLKGVVVVVPQGYDQSLIAGIVAQKQAWIQKSLAKLGSQSQAQPLLLPRQLELQAIAQTWQIDYLQAGNSSGLRLMPNQSNQSLMLTSSYALHQLPPALWQKALASWLKSKGQEYLVPWLRAMSQKVALPCKQISIRGQKTLWASCSRHQDISLNYKLLFVSPQLVEYVFVHELCHTQHMNHSRDFWQLVAAKMPDYQCRDRALVQAWRQLPWGV
ncbi:MAG: SprT family zinc-dependent metalloprotease [Pseudanabaenaceae cyanobacterium bins.68]|nr:SprT family zinc-dependent metalloprotease [Pseudanabaenaceae cyanobacterium bins.68]